MDDSNLIMENKFEARVNKAEIEEQKAAGEKMERLTEGISCSNNTGEQFDPSDHESNISSRCSVK
jgi:hypothetical protein